MICKWDNPLSVNKIIELAKDVKNTPIDKLRRFILESLNNPNAIIYVDRVDDGIKGFVFATIEKWQCEDALFIHMCAIKSIPEEKYAGCELLTKLKLFAKERNIKILLMATQRNYKAFERKYGFSFEGTILKLDLAKEKEPSHE